MSGRVSVSELSEWPKEFYITSVTTVWCAERWRLINRAPIQISGKIIDAVNVNYIIKMKYHICKMLTQTVDFTIN